MTFLDGFFRGLCLFLPPAWTLVLVVVAVANPTPWNVAHAVVVPFAFIGAMKLGEWSVRQATTNMTEEA